MDGLAKVMAQDDDIGNRTVYVGVNVAVNDAVFSTLLEVTIVRIPVAIVPVAVEKEALLPSPIIPSVPMPS